MSKLRERYAAHVVEVGIQHGERVAWAHLLQAYDDIERLPDDVCDLEIVDGVLQVAVEAIREANALAIEHDIDPHAETEALAELLVVGWWRRFDGGGLTPTEAAAALSQFLELATFDSEQEADLGFLLVYGDGRSHDAFVALVEHFVAANATALHTFVAALVSATSREVAGQFLAAFLSDQARAQGRKALKAV